MKDYPKYKIDKEGHAYVVRKFTGFDHHWAEYSKPIKAFDTKKEAEMFIAQQDTSKGELDENT